MNENTELKYNEPWTLKLLTSLAIKTSFLEPSFIYFSHVSWKSLLERRPVNVSYCINPVPSLFCLTERTS